MPVYNDNNDFISIDGVEINSLWIEIGIVAIVDSEDITAGSAGYRERIETVIDYQLTMKIIYEKDFIHQLLRLLRPGAHRIIYGPEGNGTGKPKHDQVFIFPQIEVGGNVDKTQARVFDVTAQAKSAPTSDMYNEGRF